ncbi:MAG: PDZ domain-containing protein [Bacteroidota bacterium]
MSYRLCLSCLLAGQILLSLSFGQELTRRAFLGIRLSTIEDSLRLDNQIPSKGGILVQQVFGQSSASAAGLEAGDMIWKLGGEEIEGPAQFLSILRGYKTGDQVNIQFSRQGKKKNQKLTLLPFPPETYEQATVKYGMVDGPLGPLRTILTLPKNAGTQPPAVVYLIQGIDCSSIDIPFNPQSGFAQVIRALSAAGYASFRVEKSGVGDSQGKACRECDFHEDREGFLRGLSYVKRLADIDSEKVYLFGLSMGGVWGPLLAKEESIAGLAVFGTISRPWMEYMLENSRRQAYLGGEDPGIVEQQLKQDAKIYHHWLSEGKTPAQIIEEFPEFEARLKMWSTRPMEVPLKHMHADRVYSFQSQLQEINLSQTWQGLDTDVLVMWGKGDYVSNREDHQLIAEIVNNQHPGKATYVEVESDHFFNTATSEEEAYRNLRQGNPGPKNPAIFEQLIQWLEKVEGS